MEEARQSGHPEICRAEGSLDANTQVEDDDDETAATIQDSDFLVLAINQISASGLYV